MWSEPDVCLPLRSVSPVQVWVGHVWASNSSDNTIGSTIVWVADVAQPVGRVLFSALVVGSTLVIFPETLRSEGALIPASIFSRANTLTQSTGAQIMNKGRRDRNTQLFETAFIPV